MTTKSRDSSIILPWIIFTLAALFYAYQYWLRVSPGVMTLSLMYSYRINSALVLGNLVAYYFYIYAPMQIPVGLLIDRYGVRRMLTLAGICCALGIYFFASSGNLMLAEFGRFMIGFGSAFAFIGVVKLATIWLPSNRFGFITGITLSIGVLGGAIGTLLISELIQIDGWKMACYLSAIFGILLTLAMFLLLKKGAKQSAAPITETNSEFKTILKDLKQLMHDSNIWINGIIGSLLFIPLTTFATLWGEPFFISADGYSNTQASGAVATMLLGVAVGGPIYGWVSDKIRQRRLPLTIGTILATIFISMIFYVPGLTIKETYVLCFCFGLGLSSQILVFSICRELTPQNIIGSSIAFTNTLVVLGGVICLPLIGWLLDVFWRGKTIAGKHIYSTGDFQIAMLLLPIGILIAVFLTFFLRETRCKQVNGETDQGNIE